MESAFLAHFDFCLNKKENGYMRGNLDISTQSEIHESGPSFHATFENLVEELENAVNRYRNCHLNG